MISVIIPVYNSEKTLARCLESLLAQSFCNYELIIVNDGSTDASSTIINQFAEKDARVVGIAKDNSGVSSARNLGIEVSRGEYICFVDSDDYVTHNYLEDLYNCIIDSEVDLAMCLISRSKKMESVDETFFHDCNEIIKTIIINDYHNAGPYNKLFKRQLIGDLRFAEDIYLGEDTLFCVEYAKKCRNAVRLNKVLYYYEIPTSSTLYVKDKTKLHRNLSVIESRKRMLLNIKMLNDETKNLIKDSFSGMCSYIATLGVSYNILSMIRHIARELQWAEKNISLQLTARQRLLTINPLLFYIITKGQLKGDALLYYTKKMLK